MDELEVKLENCYGIGSLDVTFTFTERSVHVIYAANGVMKTSFAKTFSKLSKKKDDGDPEELIYGAEPAWDVRVDGRAIMPAEICVIEPHEDEYQAEHVSVLVANSELKSEYEMLISDLENTKNKFVKILASASKVKGKEVENQVKDDIGLPAKDRRSFFWALTRVEDELEQDLGKYSGLQYSKIFNDSTAKILNDKDFLDNVNSYVEKYNAIIEKSHFFKKGIFNPTKAEEVASQLEKNGYFQAAHKLALSLRGESKIINNKQELVDFINVEKASIEGDKDLEETYNRLDVLISKNNDLREFREYLSANRVIVEGLSDQRDFKQKIWMSYFLANRQEYDDVVKKFKNAEKEISRILADAKKDQGEWVPVVNEFNDRFEVPFVVGIENKADAVLGKEGPAFNFKYNDEVRGEKPVEHGDLMKVLSRGERKALYLLNVIFEVKARLAEERPTLYVIDDIADSFDYKNKYAIVEYLDDMSQEDTVRQIILTHNFDFYRTICSRLKLRDGHSWDAIRNAESNEILLNEGKYPDNPVKDWKRFWATPGTVKESNMAKVIASVPMVREIKTLTDDSKGKDVLNCALHIKDGSEGLTFGRVLTAMRKPPADGGEPHGKDGGDGSLGEKLWANVVHNTAKRIAGECNSDHMKLEDKVTLSIAIRLVAEKFVIAHFETHDEEKAEELKNIRANQTGILIREFRKRFKGTNPAEAAILNKVNLMTPEAIHLNSFMYEPLMDMSGGYLRRLYDKVMTLPLAGEGKE